MQKYLNIIRKCIDALPKADRKRLAFHAERKTGIICGPGLSNTGAIALYILASTRKIPKKVWKNSKWQVRKHIMESADRQFRTAIKNVDEVSLRKLLLEYA